MSTESSSLAEALDRLPKLPLPIVAVDSDGTVLDAMTPKHRHAFTPALIDVWALQSRAEKVTRSFLGLNLYSPHRGVNRFVALGLFLRENQSELPGLPSLDALLGWVSSAPALSEAALARQVAAEDDAGLRLALAWSLEVNRRCAALPSPRLFPGAAEALRLASRAARLVVVSSGARAAITSEWRHAGVDELPLLFLTQEFGPKERVLAALARRAPGPEQVLMIGDAPPDQEAARAAGTRFFPVVPSSEEESWMELSRVILPRFAGGRLDDSELHARHERWSRSLDALASVALETA